MITYYELGPDKQLNEIVVAGSHDAGITGGATNVKTQSLDIGEQASAGVRVFDLRIAATSVPGQRAGLPKQAELKAFHANPAAMKNETKSRHLGDGMMVDLQRTKFKLDAGDFGLGLNQMLRDAEHFVTIDAPDEFLILKFDKCLNWPLIADACRDKLGDVMFKRHVNLNTRKLSELAGHVICVFSDKGVIEIAHQRNWGPIHGILGFTNLSSSSVGYQDDYPGLQYYGKGGTSVAKPFNKLTQNEKKQRKLVGGATRAGPEVMGMMYWTTTGILESIDERNDTMWEAPNVAKLKRLWAQGLAEYVYQENPLDIPEGSPAIGPIRKQKLPNIVMIDFADERKCAVIRGLNDLTPDQLARLGGDA
jgi:hypothetical protein